MKSSFQALEKGFCYYGGGQYFKLPHCWLNPSLMLFDSERIQILLGKQGEILKEGAT